VGRGFESHLRLFMSDLARSVEEILTRLVETLPKNTASLEAIPAETSDNGWSTFTVTPTRSSAARIQVAVDAPDIYLSLGRGAVYELVPEGRRYSDLTQLDELRALCLAAVRGEFDETVWLKGDDVVGARGRAKIGSGEVGDLWRQVFTNPLRRTRKRVYAYDPYD
jgi:hypothetical protein